MKNKMKNKKIIKIKDDLIIHNIDGKEYVEAKHFFKIRSENFKLKLQIRKIFEIIKNV